jgi:hypothetical protein
MPQKFVTVAKFFDPMAAQLVKNRLESEGIHVFLNGDASGGAFPGLGGAFNSVYVQVFEDDFEQAQAILEAADEEMTDDSSPGSTAITDREAFRGKATDAATPETTEEVQAAPRMQARSDTTESGITREPPPAGPPAVGSDETDSPVIHWRSDDLATRAWRAAVFALMLMALGSPFSGGLFLVGVPVQCYSLWLLARLALMQEDLGSRQTWQLYGALAGNAAGFFLILARCVYPWFWLI